MNINSINTTNFTGLTIKNVTPDIKETYIDNDKFLHKLAEKNDIFIKYDNSTSNEMLKILKITVRPLGRKGVFRKIFNLDRYTDYFLTGMPQIPGILNITIGKVVFKMLEKHNLKP